MKRLILAIAILCVGTAAFAAGEGEAGAGTTRGRYLAGQGIVIPPEEIFVDSYVASVDYDYPNPDGDFGAYLYTGNRQYSAAGGEGILHIGIQGQKRDFADLPPLNLAFVIDRSGSMSEDDKLAWVKQAFDVFLEQVRDQDYVALVTFNDEVEVVFPSTQMSRSETREAFRDAVYEITAGGGSDIQAGLEAGYEQILGNYRVDYTNRVLFLSDGTDISSRLSRAGAQTGDIRATLIWNNTNDLDLYVQEPSGETVYYGRRRSSTDGQLDVDMNVRGETNKPVENIFWPEGQAPSGRYRVFVQNFSYNEENHDRFPFTVEIKNGNEITSYELAIEGTGEDSRVEVAEFDYQTAEGVEEERAGILEVADAYRRLDVYLSTIGVGVGFDVDLMVNLARAGGGSSRFISDREEMEKIFGSEFDRMAVPAAHNLDMTLELAPDVEILETWGYRHQIDGNTIRYSLATLHNGDYETILVRYRLPPQEETGTRHLADFRVDYDRILSGGPTRLGPATVDITVVDEESPVVGFSDSLVLRSGSVLHFAQGLIDIGELYYSVQDDFTEVAQMTAALPEEPSDDQLRRIEVAQQRAGAKLQSSLDQTVNLKKELTNAALRSENEDFADQISILDAYIDIFGRELELGDERVAEAMADTELDVPTPNRPIDRHFSNLFDEMLLGLAIEQKPVVAVSGFTVRDGSTNALITLLDEMVTVAFGQDTSVDLVERARLDSVLEEQELALSGLVDTATAVEVGRILSADYIVTGTVLPSANSVIVFGRVVNVQTGRVESAAQVVVTRNEEINSLLDS